MKYFNFPALVAALIMAMTIAVPGHGEEQRIVVGPGETVPLGVVVFPPNLAGNDVVNEWTVSDVFGFQNQAGVMASPNPESADIIEVAGTNGNLRPVFFHPANGWLFADDNGDASSESFPITAGLVLHRAGTVPLELIFQGEFRTSPVNVQLHPGLNLINRTFPQPFTLGDIELELRSALNLNDDPNLADIVQFPNLAMQLYLDTSGQWRKVTGRDVVDPHSVEIADVFEIDRRTTPTSFPLFPQSPPPEIILPLQALSESAPGRLNGVQIDQLQNICLVGVGSRLVPLRVAQRIGDGDLVFQTGRVPDPVPLEKIEISRGLGAIAPVEPTENFEFRDPVWTFRSDMPVTESVIYSGNIDPERPREGELRYFSFVENGTLYVNVGAPESWPEGSLIDLHFLALLETGAKIALTSTRIRLKAEVSTDFVLGHLGEYLAKTLGDRGIVDEREVDFDINRLAGGEQQLSIALPDRIANGILDLNVQIPPEPPTIESVAGTIATDGIVVIEGSGFGDRVDDVCVALVDQDGGFVSIGMRALAVTNDGKRLFAQVIGNLNDAEPRRVMLSRGRGATRRFIFGVQDLVQNQGIWVWEGLGTEGVISPEPLAPALAFDDEICSTGTLAGGKLRNTLAEEWPEHSRVRVSFTANTRGRDLDYYAPDICFTRSGETEDCAQMIREVVGSAFIQEGMANGNTLTVQTSVPDAGNATLEVSLYTNTGALDPISSGHFNVCHTADADCDVPEIDDMDGDGLDDGWEERFFGEAPEDVDPDGNPDGDDLTTRGEFAFHSDPLVFDSREVDKFIIDANGRPSLTYFQHETSSRAFHYSMESSTGEGIWTLAPSFEFRSSKLGSERVRVTATSRLTTDQLGASLLRIRATPRLP
ncbi:MAG: hypothetical protein KDN22_02755 [Verrucomicrobiae bacterium]|nr:hypothetical protein [Verrucomicrobiae bacterium]